MVAKEELRKIIDNSGEKIKVVLHYWKPADMDKSIKGVQWGEYKCLEGVEFDSKTLKAVLKDIIEETIKEF